MTVADLRSHRLSVTATATAEERARAGVSMTMASMACVQVGLGASVALADRLGGVEVGWLRLVWASLVVALLGRVWRLRPTARQLRTATLLGVATGTFTVCFMAAATRMPLGTVSALEFLGPLSVALLGRRHLSPVWPLLAGVGVVLLTRPWSGEVDGVGLLLALGSAAGYAAYIVLTQRVGDGLGGVSGLGISVPVAAVVATGAVVVTGDVGAVVGSLDLGTLLVLLGLAVLVPVVPYSLEMLALRWVDTAVFGTLVCFEPVMACLVGLVLLGQVPTWSAACGVVLVVVAGVAAAQGGGRR